MLLELAILVVLHADDKNEAEQVFRKMETKLANAKSLEVTYEGKRQFEKSFQNMSGSLVLAEGNKSRWDRSIRSGEAGAKSTIICDGEMRVRGSATECAPKWLNDAQRLVLARCDLGLDAGFILLFPGALENEEFKADDELKVSEFKLGKKEKVGDREAQAVQYNLQIAVHESKPPRAVTVWIDTKTNLPLKREVVYKNPEGFVEYTITETYSKWSIDEKIDPKRFEVPKD